MIGREEALALVKEHLADSPVAAHSMFVGDLMAGLAAVLRLDQAVWQVTGYCHDLDLFDVGDDMSRHGPTAAHWLMGQLPQEALIAIAAHDHRAGIRADSTLARGLRLADALAVLDKALGRAVVGHLAHMSAEELVSLHLPQRPWLGEMIDDLSEAIGITRAEMAGCLSQRPEQP